MEYESHKQTPLDPPNSNPASEQDTSRREHANPGVQGKELPQPSNRGNTNNIDEK